MSYERKGDVVLLGVKHGAPRAIISIGNTGEGRHQVPAPGTADTKADHTSSVVMVNVSGSEKEIVYAPWGSNNLRPNTLMAEADKSGILKAGMTVRQRTHYGDGPQYFDMVVEGDRDKMSPRLESKLPPAVRDFHKRSKLDAFYREAVNNFEWWGWTLTEMVVSNDCRQVLSMRCLKTAWGRWSLHNEEGRSEWLVYNPNWALYNTQFTKVVPVADPWWTPEEVRQWLKDTGYRKFILPTILPDPDSGYYPDMDWYALYESKWLQGTNRIPAIRDQIIKRSVRLQMHIKIPANYFEQKFKDIWANLDEAARMAKEAEVIELWDNFFTGEGEDDAGSVMFTRYLSDELGNPIPGSGWEVIPIEAKAQNGVLIPDAEKGNSEILATIGVDPSLLGQGAPGGKLGAGSGSDKFEAVRILWAFLCMSQDMTTESWQFVRDYNGWDENLYIGYRPLDLAALKEPGKDDAPKPAPDPTKPAPDAGHQ